MEYKYDSRKNRASRMKREETFFSVSHFVTPLPPVTWNHTFSAKERDTETGYSYFGSRYYNSDLSIWLSVDPMAHKYPSLSPYVYCANNPIKLVDPNGEELTDDIVIHGKNNSSITIKTELVDWNFDVDLDFRGNYEVNPDNVAIGYEYGVDASGRAGVGTSYNAYKQSVMFLGGSYAGYWYDYIGGEAQIDASLSAAGNIGVHKNMFIAINNNPATYNPKDFAGEYSGASLSLSWKALAGISADGQFATSKDGTWNVISLGISGSIGAQVGLFAGFDATAGAHLGGLKLITNMKPTKSRSLFDIGKNWVSHLFY